MVFSSPLFLFYFLPFALLAYYLSPRGARNLTLTLLSTVFYCWANPAFLALLATTMLLDYLCGLAMVRGLPRDPDGRPPLLTPGGPRSLGQKAALIVSLAVNLAMLGFFKYFNFGVDSVNALVQALGLEALRIDTVIRVALPLGISFFTFQAMSYTIDIYRGDARAMHRLVDFACFDIMFPQVVAGPIVRFSEVADQLGRRAHTLEKFARGSAFLALGLGKKVLLANPCGKVADTVFDAGSRGLADAWTGAVAYAFQIYFDFSGYSDMAVGLGLMLGFVFARNFDDPYRSESITEFWRRWHISLSSWLRDYLYVPLGGNRKGPGRTYVNLALTMLLGGLWHGAAWNFVIWGAWHGAWLCLERALGKAAPYARLPRPARVAVTFLVVLVSWVFFRARDLPTALAYLGSMAGLGTPQPAAFLIDGVIAKPYYLLSLLVAAVCVWSGPQAWTYTRRLTPARSFACLVVLLLALAALSTQAYNPFIYYIF